MKVSKSKSLGCEVKKEEKLIGHVGIGEILKVSYPVVRKLIERKQLKAQRVGSIYVAHESDVIEFGKTFKKGKHYGKICEEDAEDLWMMLDSIEVESEKVKTGSLKSLLSFYNKAVKKTQERHEVLESDGKQLFGRK